MGSLALGMKDLETAFGWSDRNPMPREKYATWPNRMLELGSGFVTRRCEDFRESNFMNFDQRLIKLYKCLAYLIFYILGVATPN